WPAGFDHQVARLDDAGSRSGCLVQTRRADWFDGTANGSRNRNPAGDRERAKVTHHALARLQQDDPNNAADDAPGVGGLFMEWAVGKQGEQMRPDTGKLMLPGSKIIFEMHYHSVGEEIKDHVELGIYFYPKGQEPKYRQTLAALQS